MASSRVLPSSYNEKTYKASGGDYSVLNTWEAATDIDLVTATKGEVLTCDAGIYDDYIFSSGATTSSSYFRVVRAATGARGTPTSGVRFVKVWTSSNQMLYWDEDYFGMYDIACKTTTTTTNIYAIAFGCYAAYGKFIGCTAYDCLGNGTAFVRGFNVGSNTVNNGINYVINCYAVNCTGGSGTVKAGIVIQCAEAVTRQTYVYNCTVKDSIVGFYANEAAGTFTPYLKNCISQNNTTDLIEVNCTWQQTTNVTSDDVVFAADGYHLASNDTVAINNGTDLSADGSFAFDDDIDGETRNDWDIGADEYVSTATLKLRCLMGCGQ